MSASLNLSQEDIARLVAEMAKVVKGAVVRNVWRESSDVYGILLAEEVDGRSLAVLEISLVPETSRFVCIPPEPVDKRTIKARKRDSSHALDRLRQILIGARVTELRQIEGDRIVVLELDARQEDGLEPCSVPWLAIELTGRRTNLVLMDGANREIIVVHRHGRGQGGRDLVAGETWEEPKKRGRDSTPTALTERELLEDGPLELNRRVAADLREAEGLNEQRSRRGQLRQAAKRGLKRLTGRLSKLERELEEARGADMLQREAELLKTHAKQIPDGARTFKATDYHEDPPVERELKLDPRKSPLDQADALFKRVKKLRRGLMNMETRAGQAEADVEDLEALIQTIDNTEDDDETALNRIESKLETLGCMPKKKSEKKGRPQQNQGPRKFTSSDGLTILVGRSNRENDKLSIRTARGNDIFFHVRGSPGSHVIVRKPKDKSVPLDTLLDAATLAIHYSKQRGNPGAEVSYTPAKYVRKPKGAKPGLVQISNEKVLRPGGDAERLSRLLDSLDQGSDS